MELGDAVDNIYRLGMNGDQEVYNKLSEQSINELKGYTKQEVVESLERFFKNKFYLFSDTRVKDTFDYAEAYFIDYNTMAPFKVIFTKEQQEWKIIWSLKAFRANS